MKPLLFFLLISITAFTGSIAVACTEDRVLELVRNLEAPGGYDTVYAGARVPPPQPITSMSVADVLQWQRQTVGRGSVSTAAGQYQIIRPTLQRLVNDGVVSLTDRFDATTQDRLGRHLLRETGYQAGDTGTATANRIAQVWAALPDITTGQSAYEGIAGNHALITAAMWRGVLDCSISPDNGRLLAQVAAIRSGEQFGFSWDRALEEMAVAADTILRSIGRVAVSLLLGLYVIDLVIRAGGWIFAGRLPGVLRGFVFRFMVVVLCLALLQFPADILEFLKRTAFSIAGTAGATDFSVANFARDKIHLVMSLMEGLAIFPPVIRNAAQVLTVPIIITGGVQMAAMLYWTVNLVLVMAAGLLAVGFGGLQETTPAAKAYVRQLIGATLSLMTALIIMSTLAPLSWDLRAAGAQPLPTIITILLMELMAMILIWTLPSAVGAVANGPGQKHPNPFRSVTLSKVGNPVLKTLTRSVGTRK